MGHTIEEIEKIMNEHVDKLNKLLELGLPMQQRPTKGELRRLASKDASEFRKKNPHLFPNRGWNAGHVPDTTWTGLPKPPGGYQPMPEWLNKSLGSQAAKRYKNVIPWEFTWEWVD